MFQSHTSISMLLHCILQLPYISVILSLVLSPSHSFITSQVMYLALRFCAAMVWTLLLIYSMQVEANRMRLRLGQWRCSTLHSAFWG